jgi:hypothetical protein
LNLNPICWRKESASCWMLLLPWHPGFNFTCTSCVICGLKTETV